MWDVSITPGDREGRAAPLEPIELAEPGVASGRVLDAHGLPVRGARVGAGLVPAFVPAGARLPGFVESDERGHFELRGLEPGRQTLSAYAAGAGRGSLDDVIITSRERTTGLEIRLAPTHAESEPAIANVAVTLGERGAGAELEVVIVNVAAGSEAERAGVRQGDVLWSVDDQIVADMTDARAMLGGSDGSDVILELERQGDTTQGDTVFVRVRREAVR
jgi:membrane-associated protease RseP (regulator of RpoE activity)